ncbi:MAG: metal-sulfur cluster assembly factor [Pseudomonadota bacterium]|jgi:metal-sulfur cluster biosynthetic enzyme
MSDESMAPEQPTRDAIIEVLKTVEDPELFLDIWFLGLIYNINIDGGNVVVDMTFTSPMCPAGPQLKHEVQSKIAALPGVKEVSVVITFTPPWEPSDEVKGLLGMM